MKRAFMLVEVVAPDECFDEENFDNLDDRLIDNSTDIENGIRSVIQQYVLTFAPDNEDDVRVSFVDSSLVTGKTRYPKLPRPKVK